MMQEFSDRRRDKPSRHAVQQEAFELAEQFEQSLRDVVVDDDDDDEFDDDFDEFDEEEEKKEEEQRRQLAKANMTRNGNIMHAASTIDLDLILPPHPTVTPYYTALYQRSHSHTF
jgi:predicted enzyme involved in methoxymalonyl-ACP biosynthesis